MADYGILTDQELTALLKEGDKHAYTEVYNRYFVPLFLHVLKRLRDEDEAKDLVQELFTSLWIKRESVFAKTNLSNYLFTATRNGVFNFIAKQKVASRYIDTLPSFIDIGECLTDHLARERQLSAIIDKEIADLPIKMRIVFELSRKEGMTYKEIAEQLGLSEETIKSQIKNALRILRVKLGIVIYLIWLINS